MLTDKLFTGQREITGLGIYHYGARFYSPKLGRFLSADTIVPSYANPQNLNRYSYVTNNPLRYIDPTGHRPEDGYAGTSGCSNPKYCNNGRPKSKQELARMRRDRRNNNGGGGGGHPLLSPNASTGAQGGSSSGGDENVGYEINYDVGVVQLHYYGQNNVINLNELATDTVEYQALMDFESNAVDRANALDDIESAQSSFVSNSIIAIGGAALAGLSLVSTPATGPLGVGGTLVGVAIAFGEGVNVYNSAMAWGQAAQANQTANANLSATWATLNTLP